MIATLAESAAMLQEPHELPDGWTWVQLSEICEAVNGRAFKSSEWRERGLPIIRIQNLKNPDAPFNYFDGEIDEKHRVKKGDLLFAWSGTPGTSFGAHIWKGPDAALNQHIFNIRFDDSEIGTKYFQYALNQNVARYVAQAQGGVGLAHITKKKFMASKIPLGPLAEQQSLVAELDKQFSRLDEVVTNLHRVKANLKRYKAAVLKAAVEGRLVKTEAELARREGHDFEPADALIARTEAPPRPNRYSTRSKDVIPGHSALAVGKPKSRLPPGWAWVPLVEVARMESGHTPSRKHPEWWDGDIPWIGIADAREHHGGEIDDTAQHTNVDGLANSAARLLPAGTVCVSRTASVGYVVLMGQPMATSQDFVNWVPTNAVSSDWLRLVFLADREALVRFGKGSVHKTIYFPEWLSIHIALPPRNEQDRIVAEVGRHLSLFEMAEGQMSTNLERTNALHESMLRAAFVGNSATRGDSTLLGKGEC